jgi:hypothetical protein
MNQTPLAQQVNNPSLTLYAFHLCQSLSEGSEQMKPDANHLWEQFVKLGKELKIDTLKSFKSVLEEKAVEQSYQNKHSHLPLELLGTQRTLEFQLPVESSIPQVSGEIYPLRLHDTYGVDLTLRYEKPVDVVQLSQLNPNGFLLSNWIRPSLGETLLFFAEPSNPIADYQALADDCVAALLSQTPQPQPICIAQGKLFGSPIFEYDNEQEDPFQYCHLWVWFNTHENTLETIGETADYVMNLLCCRHKILFAYHQARSCYWEARKLYSQLENEVQIFNSLPADLGERLDKLKALLTTISPIAFRYSRLLRDMHDNIQSIITNTENYSRWPQKIFQKSLEKFADDDLKFLENFRDRTCQRLQQQIQTDLNYLSPGQEMFQQAIAISRGLVEIDQAERDRQRQDQLRRLEDKEEQKRQQQENREKERDRNFQTTVFAVATGLSVGGIVISASSQVPDPAKNPKLVMPWSPNASASVHPFIVWVVGSIISALVAAWIAGLVTQYWQKRTEEQEKSPGV